MAADADFVRLISPFRGELLAHCYRMLGSVHDAEDQVQETLVRAWRFYGQFEGRASLRSWLYRIATNACLRALENRNGRPLPSGLGGPGVNPEGHLVSAPEVPWLQPIPDALLPAEPPDPASVVVSRRSVRLALVTALQRLPPRQRAVLILRDVVGMRAAEVAELLGTTNAAVNSALQRARAHLEEQAPAADDVAEPIDPNQRAVVDRYAAAFEDADIATLTRLLTDDAVLEMPPFATWFIGSEAIGGFLEAHVFAVPRDIRLVPTAANGQPAFASYVRGHGAVRNAHAVHVLTVKRSRIARMTTFLDPSLFATFGLPPAMPATAVAPLVARPSQEPICLIGSP